MIGCPAGSPRVTVGNALRGMLARAATSYLTGGSVSRMPLERPIEAITTPLTVT